MKHGRIKQGVLQGSIVYFAGIEVATRKAASVTTKCGIAIHADAIYIRWHEIYLYNGRFHQNHINE